MKKFLASLAATAVALVGLGTVAATGATASVRHSDFYVQTIGHGWVAEDQLTADELMDLATVCQPVAVAVDVTLATASDGSTTTSGLTPVDEAPVAWINQANFDQIGLTLPSFIGPTGYGVTSSGSYYCL